ncbi:MAG: DUF4037 domain-containing protein [Chloroflexi bacterium]|jgi:hypothetical protein|nr:DUF4037 domain-containing protein [Chloroflexota bacterium]
MSGSPASPEVLARRVAALFAPLPQVVAVALGGSRGGAGLGAVAGSDIDIEVYVREEVDLGARRAIVGAAGGARRAELGMRFWGPSDEWIDAATGAHVDVVYFETAWMEERIAAILDRHEASLGYSTCFWHTVRGCLVLEDPEGWLAGMKARCDVPYPEALRASIVRLNHPVLRSVLPSYANQLAKAAAREDLVSVQHRLAGLLASYFDMLFAVNRATHPGEKRLVEAATRTCDRLPEGMATDLDDLLRTSMTDLPGLPGRVDRLIDRLDALLRAEGFTDDDLPSLRALPPGALPSE